MDLLTFTVNRQSVNLCVREDSKWDAVVYREAFVENTYALYEGYFEHTGIMVDIGANIGAVSILCHLLGARRVIAYEPEPFNCDVFKKNVHINYLEGIELHQEAVWSAEQMIPLVVDTAASSSQPQKLLEFPDQVMQVQAVTLEQVLAPFEDVDVLKVDTEGAEYEIFQNQAVNRKARHIVMEYHTATTEKFGGLLALLSLTHHITAFGKYDTSGGQIIARRYGD